MPDIIILGPVEYEPADRKSYLTHVVGLAKPARREPGVRRYAIVADPHSATGVLVMEHYVSADALEAHRTSAHLKRFSRHGGFPSRSSSEAHVAHSGHRGPATTSVGDTAATDRGQFQFTQVRRIDPPMIRGECESRLRPLHDLLASNLASGVDHGAAVAVTRDGELVADLWGGWADAGRSQPWEASTLVLVMSITKALTGLCGNMCIERGLLDPDAPVCAYWPEFAVHGKEHVLVKHVFDHRAGLPTVPVDRDCWGDWDEVCLALASSPPAWEPGTAHSYHSFSYGWLVGELIRRVTGRMPNDFLQAEVCEPLGVEAWIGAPAAVDERIAAVVPEQELVMNRRWEIPAANGFSNARSVARILGVLACGGRLGGTHLLDQRTIDDATAEAATGPWHGGVLHPLLSTIRFARGFQLNSEFMYMGPNRRAFGHAGGGGAMAWADPERHVSFAYTPNLYEGDLGRMYDRANELSRCVFDCVA